MNHFLKNNNGDVTQRVILLALAGIIVIALFRFSVYTRCVNNISLDQISSQVTGFLLTDPPGNCAMTGENGETPGGVGGIGGPITEDNDQLPPPDSTTIPTSYYNSSGVNVACSATQSYYNFKIPTQTTPQGTGTQTLYITNNTGWDMWIKIIHVSPFNGFKMDSYTNNYQHLPNGKQIYFNVNWLWDVSSPTSNLGAATVYFSNVCEKPAQNQIINLPPLPPTHFKASDVTSSGSTLSWTPSINANKYEIIQSGTVLYSGSASEFTVSGLRPANEYSYSLRAGNENGWSNSISISFTTLGSSLKPSAPNNFRVVSKTDTTITFAWDSDPKAATYTFAKDNTTLFTGPDFYTYTVKKLKPGATNNYQVKAANSYGESAWTTISADSALIGHSPIPAPAQNFRMVSVTDTTITMQWNPVPNADSYYINVSQPNGTRGYAGTGTTATITGLMPGMTYPLYLYSKNSADISVPAFASVTTTGTLPLPSAPSNIRATDTTNTSITLEWSPSLRADRYMIYQNGALVYSGTASSFTASGLTKNTSYPFVIYGINEVGLSQGITFTTSTSNFNYDHSSDINTTCQLNSFDRTFTFPTLTKVGISGIFEVNISNPSNQSLQVNIVSIEKNGSLFEGSTPVMLEFDPATKTATANGSLQIPIKWILPANASSSYIDATGSIVIHMKATC